MAHMYFICTFIFFCSICSLVDLQTVIICGKCFRYSGLSLRSRADIVSFVPQFLALQKRPCYFELHPLNFLYIAVARFLSITSFILTTDTSFNCGLLFH